MRRLAFVVALGVLGCNSGSDPPPQSSSSSGGVSCLPGQQFPCICSDGKHGGQICNLAGNAVGACTCGAGGGGGSSTSSSSSSSSTSSSSGGGGGASSSSGMGGGGGGGGMGGAGGGGVCVPGSKLSCYDGPAGTIGVGACAGGNRVCNGNGSGYGACLGQVLPVAENCTTQVDDDCNGLVNEGGAGCSCSPGTQAACYSAAASTLLFGICHAGQQLCKADGTGYGPCMGEVDPQPESCDTLADDNCNGKVNEGGPGSVDCVCKPGATAACYDGPAGTQNLGVCTAGTKTCNTLGNGYGACLDEVTPQQDLCGTPEDEDCNNLALPCLDPAPAQQDFGFMGLSGSVTSIASDTSANVIIGGPSGSFDYGNGSKITGNPGVVVKLGSGLDWVWGKGLPGAVQGVAVDPSNNNAVIATGSFIGSVDFGGGPPLVMSAAGFTSTFVVKWDQNGNFQWAKPFGGTSSNTLGTGVAVDTAGNIVVTGTFTSSFVDFGGGQLPYVPNASNFFVLKLNGLDGTHLWSRGFAHGEGVTLTTDLNNDVLLAGAFKETMVLGLAPVESLFSVQKSFDGFVAKLDGNTGTFLWGRAFGDKEEQRAVGVATDPQRNVLVTGWFDGTVDLGGGPIVAGIPGPSMLVAKLTPDDLHVWSKGFGANTVIPGGVASDDLGNVILTGTLTGTTNFGGVDVVPNATSALLAVKLNASDAHVWSYAFGDNAGGTAITTDPSGYVLLAGWNAGQGTMIDFGLGQQLTAQGDLDIVVGKISP